MAGGAGKYGEVCSRVREETEALGAVVIVFQGRLGNGFSVQAPEDFAAHLPAILEHVAATIRATSTAASKRTH